MSSPKKGRGRQKIDMKKISNDTNLQVTFSKRRGGLFKKASELCTLCGADVALLVFSPGEKVFSFGHPNVDTVIDRYLGRAPAPKSGTMRLIEAHRSNHLRDLNAQLTHINNQIDAETKRGEELAALKKVAETQFWWAKPIDEMSLAQMEQYKAELEGLKVRVKQLADKAMLQSVANPNQFYPGGASSSANPVHQAQPPQVFPPQLIQPPQVFPPQLIQPPMPQNHMFGDGTMLHHHGFNNMGMGGYGSVDHGFF